jgi:hypothetical protein
MLPNHFIYHDIEQNTEIWDSLRCGKVTSSANSIFMPNADKGTFGDPARRLAVQISLERITGKKSANRYYNDHMQRGHDQESLARALYEQEYFVNVDNGGFFESICGRYGGSPDGLVNDDGCIEIKSVIAPVHYATMRRGAHDPAYTHQLIGHLDCTGRDWVDFISYCSEFPEEKQLIVYRLYRKDYLDHIERLRKRRADFLKLIDEIEADILEKDFYKLEKETA